MCKPCHQYLTSLFLAFAFVVSFLGDLQAKSYPEDSTFNIPIGGNAWLSPNAKATISDKGLTNWTDSKDVLSVYLRPETIGKLDIALRLNVPAGSSTISISALGRTFNKTVSNPAEAVINFGSVTVKESGYIKFEIRGINKTGAVFAEITDLVLSGPALVNGAAYVKDNHGNYFYWGRRGPSVHINYKLPEEVKNTTEWFYNEVTVPIGGDVIGSYFMADGFKGGYFGMQVNSAIERRVLFSVWSPYTTDDPKTIPDHLKVQLLKKGANVHGGEFGGEGSGGQSYMIYPWAAGKTYCFLIHAQGDIAAETTIYTAYFKPLDATNWQLVASFKRPQSGTYLTSPHSFLENFDPAHGDKTRSVFFGNQWVVDIDGKWYPLTKALFTGDATAKINYRKDYAGGAGAGLFYLRNGGFFNEFTPLSSPLEVSPPMNGHPQIDLNKLL